MQARQESQLFLYKDGEQDDTLPVGVYIKIPRIGNVPCRIERMDDAEIASLHEDTKKQPAQPEVLQRSLTQRASDLGELT